VPLAGELQRTGKQREGEYNQRRNRRHSDDMMGPKNPARRDFALLRQQGPAVDKTDRQPF